MRAIILIIRLAKFAFQTCPDLSANTNTVSDLYGSNFWTNLDCFSYDLMAHTQRYARVTPALSTTEHLVFHARLLTYTSDRMHIASTYSAAFNLNIDVTVFKLLWFKLAGKIW